MTLPTNQPINGTDDDSDMFGPPRSSPPIGYHHHRSKVPMISPKLRQREERKRIIQLCAHKLERIKDSEANLRRSVCINNTYSRLNDEVRREKQNRYLANLPKPDLKPETAHDNIFSSYNSCNGGGNQNDDIINNNNNMSSSTTNNINNNNNHHHYLQNDTMEIYPNLSQHYHHFNHLQQHQQQQQQQPSISHSNSTTTTTSSSTSLSCNQLSTGKPTIPTINNNNNNNQNSTNNNSNNNHHHHHQNNSITSSSCHHNHHNSTIYSSSNSTTILSTSTSSSSSTTITTSTSQTTKQTTNNNNNNDVKKEKRFRSTFNLSNNSVDTDLEILDRELSAIDASMPLIDPEITQGAEHLQIAISSRKRLRNNNNNNNINEDENDRLVREALSQFYLPTQRLISAIDDCPLDIKRTKLNNHNHNNINIINNHNIGICGNNNHNNNNDLDLDLALDLNPTNHKEFEVIMDALRLGTPSPTSSCGNDSCGQAAMMSESGGGVFHNLVVTSLET